VNRARRASRGAGPALLLLALNNLFVGGMVGLERTVLPLPAPGAEPSAFVAASAALVIGFGASKALLNLLVGPLADRFGRRRVLLAGWLLGAPVPLLLAVGRGDPLGVLSANLLLGANQGLAWSMTLNMMIDLVPAGRRGLIAGLNEFSGYMGLALLALLSGLLAGASADGHGLEGRLPDPFELGYLLVGLGLSSALLLPETKAGATVGRAAWVPGIGVAGLLGAAINLKDGLVWLALPLLLGARGFGPAEIAIVTALYPALWAAGQLLFGAASDRLGRRSLISAGMLVQGLGLLVLAAGDGYQAALSSAALLGLGTGMAYPTLIAYVSDRSPPELRATALGAYRFFRDGGYVLGALLLLSGAPLLAAGFALGLLLAALAALAWVAL
jgi:MFS family permease